MAATAGFLPGCAPFPSARSPSSLEESAFLRIATVSRPRCGRTCAALVVREAAGRSNRRHAMARCSSDGSLDGVTGKEGDGKMRKGGSSSRGSSYGYGVPLGRTASSGITRSLAEILRDLNMPVHKFIDRDNRSIPWYRANKLLSFYAPGWCGEVRKVIFSQDGSVTVIYRITIKGSDGEAHRESTGSASSSADLGEDPVEAAEAVAFCRACARFGLGLHLYEEYNKN